MGNKFSIHAMRREVLKEKSPSKITYVVLETVFLATAIFLVKDLALLDILLIGAAASFVGRSIAYTKVFKFLRDIVGIVTVEHDSGIGATCEPRKDLHPIREVIAELVCCPVCVGTWAGLVLSALYPYFPQLTYILAIACIAWFVTVVTEYLEWKKAEAWEAAGKHRRT